MAQDFLTGLATVSDGQVVVTIDAQLNASNVGSGSSLFINGVQLPVETISGSLGVINLKKAWAGGNIVDVPFVVTYTPITLANAIDNLSVIRDNWLQSVKDVDDLVASASGAADDLIALEGDIATAQSDLASIQGSLDADKQASAASAQAAQAAESNVAVLYDNFDDRSLGAKASDPTVNNDGDPLQTGATYWNTTTNSQRFYNGVAWEDPSVTATQAATSASNSASNANNNEINSATNVGLAAAEVTKAQDEVVLANAAKTLSQQYANHPEDVLIPNTSEYSAYHWKQKASELAGGTAPDSLALGGKVADDWQAEIDDVESDVINLQTQVNTNTIFAMAGMVL